MSTMNRLMSLFRRRGTGVAIALGLVVGAPCHAQFEVTWSDPNATTTGSFEYRAVDTLTALGTNPGRAYIVAGGPIGPAGPGASLDLSIWNASGQQTGQRRSYKLTLGSSYIPESNLLDARSIQELTNGDLLVAGRHQRGAFVLRCNKDLGLLWARVIHFAATDDLRVKAIELSNGDIVVMNMSVVCFLPYPPPPVPSPPIGQLTCLSGAGAFRWTQFYSTIHDANLAFFDLAEYGGEIFVAGALSTPSFSFQSTAFIMTVDPTDGAPQALETYAHSLAAGLSGSAFTALAFGPNGLYASGFTVALSFPDPAYVTRVALIDPTTLLPTADMQYNVQLLPANGGATVVTAGGAQAAELLIAGANANRSIARHLRVDAATLAFVAGMDFGDGVPPYTNFQGMTADAADPGAAVMVGSYRHDALSATPYEGYVVRTDAGGATSCSAAWTPTTMSVFSPSAYQAETPKIAAGCFQLTEVFPVPEVAQATFCAGCPPVIPSCPSPGYFGDLQCGTLCDFIPVGATARLFSLTGDPTGIDWSWRISSPDFAGQVVKACVDGVQPTATTNAGDVAAAFADSINDRSAALVCSPSCGSSATCQLSAVAIAPAPNTNTAFLVVQVGDASGSPSLPAWELCVGSAGGSAYCCPSGDISLSCTFNPVMEEIPAAGFDCNDNGQDDAFDIALGTSFDVNGDGIPDECGSSVALTEESFEYEPPMLLSGQGGGEGWSGPWQTVGLNPSFEVVEPGLSYSDGIDALASGGNAIRGEAAVNKRSLNLISEPLGDSPGTLWVSMLAHQTSGDAAGTFMGLKLLCTGPNPELYLGKPFQQGNWGLYNGSGGGILVSSVPATTQAFLVMRVDFKAGLDDVYLFVNPSLGTDPLLNSADIAATRYGDFSGITSLLVDIGKLPASFEIEGTLDEIRLGATFAAVAPTRASGDLDGDGIVSGADLGLLLASWGDVGGAAGDLDGDGVISGSDLGLLLANWGR